MTKKSGLFTLAAATLLFSGCGGGSSGKQSITEQLKQRDGVVIVHSVNQLACSIFAAEGKKNKDVKEVVFDTPPNSVSCATYEKTKGDIDDDNAECIETTLADFSEEEDISILEDDTKACVIGVNRVY